MKRTLFVVVVAYWVGAFIAMDLNPSNWLVEGRVILATITLMFCTLLLATP